MAYGFVHLEADGLGLDHADISFRQMFRKTCQACIRATCKASLQCPLLAQVHNLSGLARVSGPAELVLQCLCPQGTQAGSVCIFAYYFALRTNVRPGQCLGRDTHTQTPYSHDAVNLPFLYLIFKDRTLFFLAYTNRLVHQGPRKLRIALSRKNGCHWTHLDPS